MRQAQPPTVPGKKNRLEKAANTVANITLTKVDQTLP